MVQKVMERSLSPEKAMSSERSEVTSMEKTTPKSRMVLVDRPRSSA